MRPAVGAATPKKPGPDEPGIAVRLEDLGMSFGKGATSVEALKGIDARIPAGRITGLVGPDAAGKTTLIRILAGLMQPTGGRALVFGRPAMELARREPNSIGYMPQRFGLYEDLTVMANLRLHASLRGLTGQARDELFARLLGFTSLGPFTERLAGRLSGGMKQKLGIACALLGSPRLLLLDEPGVGVDPQSRRELWSMVQELSHGGMTVIWSTAYLDEASRCPGVIMLDAGKVLFAGPPEDLTRRAEGRVFLLRGAADKRGRERGGGHREALARWSMRPGVEDALIQGSPSASGAGRRRARRPARGGAGPGRGTHAPGSGRRLYERRGRHQPEALALRPYCHESRPRPPRIRGRGAAAHRRPQADQEIRGLHGSA